MRDDVRSLLANLPQARFLPKPPGSVTILRDYVPQAAQRAADDFVISVGGSIADAPAHDEPTMSVVPVSAVLTAGERFYVIPAAALEADRPPG